eukprot:gene9580-1723_t
MAARTNAVGPVDVVVKAPRPFETLDNEVRRGVRKARGFRIDAQMPPLFRHARPCTRVSGHNDAQSPRLVRFARAIARLFLVPMRLAIVMAVLPPGLALLGIIGVGQRPGATTTSLCLTKSPNPKDRKSAIGRLEVGFVSVIGPFVQDKAPVVVCNHQSLADAFILVWLSHGRASFVSANHGGFVNFCLKAMQALIVDRKSPTSRQAALLSRQSHPHLPLLFLPPPPKPPCPLGHQGWDQGPCTGPERAPPPTAAASCIHPTALATAPNLGDSSACICLTNTAFHGLQICSTRPLSPPGATSTACPNPPASCSSFKVGAFGPGKPVQPVTITYPRRYKDMSYI